MVHEEIAEILARMTQRMNDMQKQINDLCCKLHEVQAEDDE